jgi:hypothetical protein
MPVKTEAKAEKCFNSDLLDYFFCNHEQISQDKLDFISQVYKIKLAVEIDSRVAELKKLCKYQ